MQLLFASLVPMHFGIFPLAALFNGFPKVPHIIDASIAHNHDVQVHHDQSAFIFFQSLAHLHHSCFALRNTQASLAQQMPQQKADFHIIDEICAFANAVFAPFVIASAHLHHLTCDVDVAFIGQVTDDA